MNKLEVTFAGVKMRNPLILASATPSWDGERSNLAWKAGAGGVVPKSFAPPSKWAQHPRSGRMNIDPTWEEPYRDGQHRALHDHDPSGLAGP